MTALLSLIVAAAPLKRSAGKAEQRSGSATATRAADGTVHVSLANRDPAHDHPLALHLPTSAEPGAREASLTAITADAMDAHNTFDAPDTLVPVELPPPHIDGDIVSLVLPAKSVALLRVTSLS